MNHDDALGDDALTGDAVTDEAVCANDSSENQHPAAVDDEAASANGASDSQETADNSESELVPRSVLDPLRLTELDRAILDFESLTWKKTAIKERAIAQRLEITPMRYYQRLAWLSTSPAASQYAPATVRRLNEAFDRKATKRFI